MKVAISSDGKTLDAMVDQRFGRAKNFIIFDTDTKQVDVVENTQNLQAAQGAGVQSGQTIVSSGAKILITGNCGPKAFMVLNQAAIKIYIGANGTIQNAIDDMLSGKLKAAGSPNVQGHWS